MNDISVIIPVYNTAPYLDRCVESVLVQRKWLKEVILVDDGSTDGSAEKCDRHEAAHPGLVRAVHQENQGAAAARNAGIALSTGKYLSFIDSDDYVEPDMYACLLQTMQDNQADMAAGSMWVEKTNGERYCRVKEQIQRCWNTREALIELNSYTYLYTSFCNAIFSRRLFEDLRFPRVRACEDYFLLYQVIARCSSVAYTSRPVYHYVQRDNSNSRRKDVSLLPLEASQAQLLFFQKNFPDIAFVAETDLAFASMSIYTSYIRQGIDPSGALLRRLRRQARLYLGAVLGNGRIPRIKKLQAIAFCFAPCVYKAVIARTEHR